MYRETYYEKSFGTWEEFGKKLEYYSQKFPNFFKNAKNIFYNGKINFYDGIVEFHFKEETSLYEKNLKSDYKMIESFFGYWLTVLAYINDEYTEKMTLDEQLFLKGIIEHFSSDACNLVETNNLLIDTDKLCELKDIMFFFSKNWLVDKTRYIKYIDDEVFEKKCLLKKSKSEAIVEQKKLNKENIYDKNIDLMLEAYGQLLDNIRSSEKCAIQAIVSNELADDKLRVLEKHISLIEKYWNEGIVVNNICISMNALINFFEMFRDEPDAVTITYEELMFLKNKISFNLLLILFHRFRISSGDREKKEFLLTVEKYFEINFEGYTERAELFDRKDIEIVDNCYEIINNYYLDYIACDIEELYSEIQLQTVLFDEFERKNELCSDREWDLLFPVQNERQKYDALIDVSKGEKKDRYIKKAKQLEGEYNKKVIIAKLPFMREQIAGSLYAIFLLIQGIKYILENNDENEDFDKMDGIFDKLLIIEVDLKKAIYKYPSMLKRHYRSENTLNVEKIVESETNAIENQKLEIQSAYQKLQQDCLAMINSKELLKVSIDEMVDALQEFDLEKIMENRSTILSNCDLLVEDEAYLENVNKKMSDIIHLIVSKSVDFAQCKERVTTELGKYKKHLSRRTMNILITAEYLYSVYVNNREKMQDFDYSSISSMYYQALESAYNELIYSKYIKSISDQMVNILKKRKSTNINLRSDDRADGYGYFPEKGERGMDLLGRYVRIDYKDGKLECFCLYDSFIKMLEKANNAEPDVCEFTKFLESEFGKKINKAKMCNFIEGMKNAREHRNNASHGGKVITYDEVICDKQTVLLQDSIVGQLYNQKIEYMDLIKKLLEFY